MKEYRNGFTLIELLVVIAIIGILAALLFPALSSTLERGRRTACRSNLRQLNVACATYSIDNNGWYPGTSSSRKTVPEPWEDYDPSVQGSAMDQQYQGKTHGLATKLNEDGLIQDTRVWICPSDRTDGAANQFKVTPADDFGSIQSFGNISYMYVAGYNDRLFPNPSQYPVFADESNQIEIGGAGKQMPPITEDDNHGESFRNVVFLDGHVEAFEDADAANAIFDRLVTDDVDHTIQSTD